MSTQEYADELREIIDRNRYSTLINSLGNILNSRKDRFDKSDIIEQSIEIYSGGRLIWIDQEGKDLHDSTADKFIEFKYSADCMYTQKKQLKPLIKIKLKNSLGKNKGIEVLNPADFYMIGQQDALAILSWEEIKPFRHEVSDGIEVHIPNDSLCFIFRPNDVIIRDKVQINYKQIKSNAQKTLIESV